MGSTSESFLAEELLRLELAVPDPVLDKLQTYIRELERWNRSVNLTALEGAALVRRLVAEPLWISQKLQLSGSLMDVGSGNGSPAVPWCVGGGLADVCLVEARAKRVAFLRHVLMRLGLKGVRVEESRVESLSTTGASVDWITLQAVRFSRELGEVFAGFASPTTRVVWITSGSAAPSLDATKFSVPGSSTDVWVLRLDQFCPTRP